MFSLALSLICFAFGFHYTQAQDFSQQWQYLDLGNDIGYNGVIVGDFDGNSYPEMYVVANSNRDIMTIQYNGQNYTVDGKLQRPRSNQGEELRIRSLALMSTDDEYGVAVTASEDKAFIYDLTSTELAAIVNWTVNTDYSYLVGQMDLASPGVGYTVDDKLVFVYGDREQGFSTKVYSGLPEEGRAVYGSFTGQNLRQLAYSDGSIFQYSNCTDTFTEIQGFPNAISTYRRLMISLDIDQDGIDEIVAHAGVGLECVSAQNFGIIWTFDASFQAHK